MTGSSRLHPARARTPHRTIPFLSSILRTAVQVLKKKKMPWQCSLFLCLRFSWWSLMWRNSTIHLVFSPLPKTAQLLFVSAIFSCFCVLLLTSQWSIQEQPCECVLLFSKEERFLCCCSSDWIHLDELLPSFKGFYWITTDCFIFFFTLFKALWPFLFR